MKKMNVILRKCKSLSKELSSKSLRSKSARHIHHNGAGGIIWNTNAISVYGVDGTGTVSGRGGEEEPHELVFVGSTRKRYVISSKFLCHPLVNALIEKSKTIGNGDVNDDVSVINCEVVLFDHLLWMIENADFHAGSDCVDELADLYAS